MSPIEKLSSTPNPAVLLLDFESAPAGLEESLAATLPEATRSRITAFCHPVRRRQTRWGRILAGAAARILDAELVEEPPYAPYLLKDERRTALCIAHTCTSIALGIASVKDPVMGLALETMRPVRSIEGMSRMSFGEAASAIVRQCAESGDSEPFFRAWGMKESEIKLNRGGSGWRLTLDEESRPVVHARRLRQPAPHRPHRRMRAHHRTRHPRRHLPHAALKASVAACAPFDFRQMV